MEHDDDFLSDITTPSTNKSYEEAPVSNDDNGYRSNNGNYNNYKKKDFKKSKFQNVKGKNEINLWDKPMVEPLELDTNKFKDGQKYATLVLANKSYMPTDEEIEKVRKIVTSLKAKDYKLRFICNYIRPIHKMVVEIMGEENCYHIVPWKSYCKDMKNDITMYLPSDMNIRGAAKYVKNFPKFQPALQYLVSSIFTTCFGLYNVEPSDYIFMIDPFYDGKKIDFEKSKDTSNYIFLSRAVSLDMYNLYNDNEYTDAMKLLN